MAWAQWWLFLVVTLSLFVGCLILNYIVNKINEVRLEERLVALQLKSPAGQVTQVPAPLLETGEATPRNLPPAKKLANSSQEAKLRVKDVSESEVEKIISKPLFLGSIYRSSEIIQDTSNGNIGSSEGPQSTESNDEYYQDILNALLDRTMAVIYSKQTDFVKKFERSSTDGDCMNSEVITLTGIRSEVIDNSVNLYALSDNVMIKTNKSM